MPISWLNSKLSITVNQSTSRSTSTFHKRSKPSATTAAGQQRSKAKRSMPIQICSRTHCVNQSALLDKSFHGTSQCLWQHGNLAQLSLAATQSFSSQLNRLH